MIVRIQSRTKQTFLWVAAIPLILGVLAYWTNRRYQDQVAWVARTEQVFTAMDRLLLTVTNAETGQRGYLLTGDEAYLTPFNSSLPELGRDLDGLRKLAGDDAEARKNL